MLRLFVLCLVSAACAEGSPVFTEQALALGGSQMVTYIGADATVAAHIRQATTDPVTNHLLHHNLHSPLFADYYTLFRNILLPENTERVIGVGGAGPSVSAAWLLSQFRTAYFFDRYPILLSELQSAIDYWDDALLWNGMQDEHKYAQFDYGYAVQQKFHHDRAGALIFELRAMGVPITQMEVGFDTDRRAVLRFRWPQEARWHEIIFVTADLENRNDMSRSVDLTAALDMWLEKGTFSVIRTLENRAALLASWLKPGGRLFLNPYTDTDKYFDTEPVLIHVGFRPLLRSLTNSWRFVPPFGNFYGWFLEAWVRTNPVKRVSKRNLAKTAG